MTNPPLPTLDEALADAFGRLAQGVTDRRSAFRTPTLGTCAPDGAPSLRSVVLRGFDPARRVLAFHTDRRSAKAAELAADPRATVHAHDREEAVQLRIAGRARLHLDDAVADAAWAGTHEGSRRVYAAALVAGTPVATPPELPRDAVAGRANFATIVFEAGSLDWLHLAPGGHRRARFAWDAAGRLSAGWVAP